MQQDNILSFEAVTKDFPGVRALDSVSFAIQKGTIHGLCGENGAGKSTLMKVLSGVYPHESYDGRVIYQGEELKLSGRSIRHAQEMGIAIVHQELTLIPDMTVAENVFIGREPKSGPSVNKHKIYADTKKILERYKLDIDAGAMVRNLGVGKMQMVEIAKALVEEAKILILDEPTSALSEAEVDTLMGIVQTVKAHGVTCLYITHKLEEFFRITDNVTVLRDGAVVATNRTKDISTEKLVALMVGRDMKERFPKGNRSPGEVVLRVQGLKARDPRDTSREVLKGVDFELRKGEILGVAGLMGSGRTELVTTIFGEYGQVTDGVIELDGESVTIANAREAMARGISLVPEDRKQQGLVLMQTILNNMSLPNLDRFSRFMRINKPAEVKETMRYYKSLSIKAPDVNTVVNSLSGGNQQKVVISKWLMSEPRILILDDPTRGIDVGAKYEIYKLMNQLAQQGISIIMISSELEEVLGMSDRVMVMWGGRSNGTLDITEATQEKIMAHATGITRRNEG